MIENETVIKRGAELRNYIIENLSNNDAYMDFGKVTYLHYSNYSNDPMRAKAHLFIRVPVKPLSDFLCQDIIAFSGWDFGGHLGVIKGSAGTLLVLNYDLYKAAEERFLSWQHVDEAEVVI